ncbi:hypothetical protein BD289DRAFT_438456 [Coniella lustricola]|uniref:Uncharacterized protein n=1 Tax=Coniella lustricola TaxID=2025994 RepID=A0A2T3A2V5_9PEZI|nr:hypothetical protein BD289DRAFT_438456 [Coniella lustricola]
MLQDILILEKAVESLSVRAMFLFLPAFLHLSFGSMISSDSGSYTTGRLVARIRNHEHIRRNSRIECSGRCHAPGGSCVSIFRYVVAM